jgi:NAD(P)-dependent dehydrogenase (short-subunit alcohol dehydrogenase family)
MTDKLIALVTGANRGIGFEVCRQLAAQDYSVIVSGRHQARVEQAAAQIAHAGGSAHPLVLDTADDRSARAAAEQVASRFARLDVLVNNAGGNFDMENVASSVSLQYVRETLEMNLLGAWRVTQAMLPLLRQSRRGRIVNVSSQVGAFESSDPYGLQQMGGAVPAYAVSKAALNALTVKLAAELRGSGILVNSVCPGWTATYPGAAEQGARPVTEGAASVVWAATLPGGGPSGGFFRDGQHLSW